MANSFPSSGTVQLENGAAVSLCVQTTVLDGNTRDAITLYENSGQASGRQAISWYNGGIPYYKARLWTQVGSGYNETTFGIDVADNSRTLDTRLIIQNGNVGINTISPSSRLDISGADGKIQSRVDSSDGSTINVRPNAGKCGWISYTEDAVADRWGIGIKNGDAKLYFSSGNVGSGGGTTRMILDASGNVGIGTSCPYSTARLQVNTGTNKNLAIQTGTTDSTAVKLNSFNDAGNANIPMELNSSLLLLKTGETEKMRITSAGRVGIGTTNPSANLEVLKEIYAIGGTNPRMVIGDTTATGNWGTLRWDTATTTFQIAHSTYSTDTGSLIINCSGNIGIKTINPGSYALNVNGAFYAAGSSQDYKEGVCKYDTDSCVFMKLKPVTYQYKQEFKHLGKELKSQTQIGLIAEEVAEVAPELAILVKENDNDVVRNVDYEKLTIVLLSEVQKLRKEVDDLKTK